MSAVTGIEWTDRTWNPVTGCTKVSPGCAHCYAETIAKRLWPTTYPMIRVPMVQTSHPIERPRRFTDVMTHEDRLLAPLSWRKPARVFVNSMSDLFHEDVPDQFIVDVFGIMALAHWHTFQVLTKRPERMRAFLSAGDHGIVKQFSAIQNGGGIGPRGMFTALDIKRRDGIEWQWPLPNVWLGVSVESQLFADERIPLLRQTPAAIRFVSAEPLLGRVELVPYIRTDVASDPLSGLEFCPRCSSGPRGETDTVECPDCGYLWSGPRLLDIAPGQQTRTVLDWVIVGGESGAGARPCDLAWVRSIVAQCHAANVPVFVKQLGANAVCKNDERDEGWPGCTVPLDDDYEPRYQGEIGPLAFRDRKGGDPAEWPADLVRQFPEARP